MTHSEFTHAVPVSRIEQEPYKTTFEANERARGLLAKRFGIEGVDRLSGEATLSREPDGMTILVRGRFVADVVQECVTTLEPVKDHIEEDFEGWFLDESQATSFQRAKKRKIEVEHGDIPLEEGEESVIPEEHEDPEPVVGGTIDVGELAAQYLSLALNPYPHSAEALAEGPLGDEKALEKPSPFAVLKDLKTK